MITTADLFEKELRRIIGEQIEEAKERLTGSPFDTIGGFEHVRGEIRALRRIDEYINEAKSIVEKRVNG